MMQGMVRLLMLLFAVAFVLTIVALISCLSAEEADLRTIPRLAWVVVILVLPVVGALTYFPAGRPVPDGAVGSGPGGAGGSGGAGRVWRSATGSGTGQRRTVAPDDDPDFLRTIDAHARAADEELLRQWEEEFRNRGDDPRKQDKSIDDSPPSDG